MTPIETAQAHNLECERAERAARQAYEAARNKTLAAALEVHKLWIEEMNRNDK